MGLRPQGEVVRSKGLCWHYWVADQKQRLEEVYAACVSVAMS